MNTNPNDAIPSYAPTTIYFLTIKENNLVNLRNSLFIHNLHIFLLSSWRFSLK